MHPGRRGEATARNEGTHSRNRRLIYGNDRRNQTAGGSGQERYAGGREHSRRVGGALAGLADIAKQQDVELGKKADKETMDIELGKKANKADMDVELGKKFDKESVAQESGDSEELVMSQKALTELNLLGNISLATIDTSLYL